MKPYSFILVKNNHNPKKINLIYYSSEGEDEAVVHSIDDYLRKSEFYETAIFPVMGRPEYIINCGERLQRRCAYHELGCRGSKEHNNAIVDELFEYLTGKGWKYELNPYLMYGREDIIFN